LEIEDVGKQSGSENRIKEGGRMKISIGTQSEIAARIKKLGHMKILVLNPKWKPLAKVNPSF